MSDSWHWKSKDCLPWTREWLREQLVGLTAEDGTGASVKVESILSVEGDVDLSQRKGKLRTLYDYALEITWKGKSLDGEEKKGRASVPEVSHDMTENEYQFEITSDERDKDSESLRDLFKTSLKPQVARILGTFGRALSDTHGPEFLEKSAGSGTATPNGSIPTHVPKTTLPQQDSNGSSSPSPTKKDQNAVNVTTINKDVELAASADMLWDLLFDPTKIPMWSKAPAKLDIKAPGSPFELFNGAISGTVVESKRPDHAVQKWRIESWPSGHYGTLKTRLLQGSNTTQVRLQLDGVPVGAEDATEEKIDQFIFRPLKMMGLGTIL